MKQSKVSLPFPTRVGFPTICPACNYDLAGAEKLDRCPECGAPIAPGASCLAIACVPRRTPGPIWRRVAWVLIALGFAALSQTWLFILVWQPWMLGVLLLACVASALGMVLTGTPVSKATERVVFSPVGIARGVWNQRDSAFHSWTGGESCRVIRLGAVWQRLMLMNGDGRVLMDLGFRCRDDALEGFAACVESYARGDQPRDEELDTIVGGPGGAHSPNPGSAPDPRGTAGVA